ncbi:NAD-binding protein [Anopheles sinensis]|uniref:NAD-binding protein n=1 Tax=Anopheles sinensis TaxID=74873 RepID=A0A084W522_ANOSI|nr:NAD-binding protein [Anopheles sinensis]
MPLLELLTVQKDSHRSGGRKMVTCTRLQFHPLANPPLCAASHHKLTSSDRRQPAVIGNDAILCQRIFLFLETHRGGPIDSGMRTQRGGSNCDRDPSPRKLPPVTPPGPVVYYFLRQSVVPDISEQSPKL